ncbi:S8 family serine peptidase [Halalkalibacterium ligniniphilum]|uniref:S8 family serine peptidase n=1 Tax=Halalkalibacterium ligniniphilum TaxID=1134413 RepID=UPI00034BDACB|nr:S8 family serine peptidase [Halalkalibacterium ligniniphilum]
MVLLRKYLFVPVVILALLASAFSTASVQAVEKQAAYKGEKEYGHIYDRLGVERPDDVEAAKKQQEEKPSFSEDTFIIQYEERLSNEVHRRVGGQVIKRFPDLGYDVVKVKGNQSVEQVVEAYAKIDGVTYASPSALYQSYASDPKLEQMYHLGQLNIEGALKLAGENEIIVAVIDTGLDTTHPELKNNLLPDYNAYEPMRRGLSDIHGTHVAGIIAGEANNGIGGMGVNPNAKILPIDVFNGMWGASDYVIAEGILYAVENGADVINMSLGGWMESKLMEAAVKHAIEAGVVVVAAAGNDGADIVSYPAAYDGVISVGATNEKKELAYFSSYGSSIDVVAPGENVYSTIDYMGKKSFVELSGTSMASPVVAGVASLLLSKYPDLTPYEVNYILQQSATDLGSPGFDTKFGYGLVDPVAALQFDLSSIPENPAVSGENVFEEAEFIEVGEDGYSTSGTITKPWETHWKSMNVQEGELVQFILDSSAPYDYKLVLKYYREGEDEPSETIEVNDVKAGVAEGYLFEAEAAGTLAIGVRDAYYKYNEAGDSSYTLTLSSYDSYLEDGISKEDPVTITSLPYDSNEDERSPFYLAGEEGDSDYFRFTAEELEVFEVKASGTPGVNTTLKLYFAEDFDQEIPEELLEELPEEYLDEMMNSEPWPFLVENSNGVGEGETMMFDAIPGQEYVLEVTSLPEYGAGFDDILMILFGLFPEVAGGGLASHVPYELSVRSEVLPPDEDHFPMGGDMGPIMEEEVADETDGLAAYLKQRLNNKQNVEIYFDGFYFGGEDDGALLEMAPEYELGTTAEGYFQFAYDIDLLKIEPETTGLYQFNVNQSEKLSPMIEVFKYNEEEEFLQYVTSSMSYNFFNAEIADEFFVGLQEGETYLLMVSNMYGNPSLDPYKISSELVATEIQDAYENNDKPEDARDVPSFAFTGNFAFQNDVDMFYLEGTEDALYAFNLEVRDTPAHRRNGLPDELYQPLDPMVMIIEDTEGDRELTDEDWARAIMFDRGWEGEGEFGSFNVKEGKGYFIVLQNWYSAPNLNSYRMTVAPANMADGDLTGEMKKDAQPLRKAGNTWTGKDFLKVGTERGHLDYYSFKLDKKQKVRMTFDTPMDIDGELTLFDAHGKELAQSNYYMAGDSEVIVKTLTKGTYYVGVRDANDNPSFNPYDVTVEIVNE